MIGCKTYRARNPGQSPLWQCAHRHFDEFIDLYPEAYQPHMGALRPIIPEVVEMVRYYGFYSNKMRGQRRRTQAAPPSLASPRVTTSPPPPWRLPSKKWRDLILQAWHSDPLRCPVCEGPMRVIAVIDQPQVVGKFCAISGYGRARPKPLAGRPVRPRRGITSPAKTLFQCLITRTS